MGCFQPGSEVVAEFAGRGKGSIIVERKLVVGMADVELDEESVKKRMVEYLHHVPQSAKPMGIRIRKRTFSGFAIQSRGGTGWDKKFQKSYEFRERESNPAILDILGHHFYI